MGEKKRKYLSEADATASAVVGDATRTGEESLRQQLRAVCNGTCDKLAWRGAEVRDGIVDNECEDPLFP